MKKIILILTVALALCSQQWVNISPFTDSNIGVFGNFVSANDGWISQGNGTTEQSIYHTSDGGKDWEKVYTANDAIISTITMIDPQNGWMSELRESSVYPYNKFRNYLKTTDGGFTWENMREHMPIDSLRDYPYYFVNKDVGFISVDVDSIDYSAIIYKTVDGGYNWYEVNTPPIVYSGENHPYWPNKFFFLDERYGWAVCYGYWDEGLTICTTDGGESWLPGLPPEHNEFCDIHFISPERGGAVSVFPSYSIEVIISEDNFNTIKYYYDEWNQNPTAICFQNDSTIWITGEPGIINKSIDGGATFSVYQTIDANLNKIQFFDKIGYIFGSNNNALYKFDSESGIEVAETAVRSCELSQNYPNPFNNETQIQFSIDRASQVKLDIYNSKGEFIHNLISSKLNKGNHNYSFKADNLNSGVYYYRLSVDGVVKDTKKMLYLR